jgi:hypothetical protein
MSVNGDALIWIDLEMDGLDLTKNFILEIACIVTDFDIKNIREGTSFFFLINIFYSFDIFQVLILLFIIQNLYLMQWDHGVWNIIQNQVLFNKF